MEVWDFIIAGGGLYNNLDYSFVAGHEDGTFVYPASQPGGGNPVFRRQMRVLRDFINDFKFIRMRPDNTVIKGGVPVTLTARALVEPAIAYAVYLRPAAVKEAKAAAMRALELDLPVGPYRAEWIDPLSGRKLKQERFEHAGGTKAIDAPAFSEDVALRVRRD